MKWQLGASLAVTQILVLVLTAAIIVQATRTVGAQHEGDTNEPAAQEMGERRPIAETRIGQRHTLRDVIIPGPERPLKLMREDNPRLVLRIANVFPHGDSFRYDLEYYGLEEGTFDLLDYMEPHSSTDARTANPLLVAIHGALPAGQIQPQPLPRGRSFGWGFYGTMAASLMVAWLLGLLAILVGRRRQPHLGIVEAAPVTLSELVQSRLQTLREREMTERECAELERIIVSHWRQRAGLEQLTYEAARQALREDVGFGPWLAELEKWLHHPHGRDGRLLIEILSSAEGHYDAEDDSRAAESATAAEATPS